MKQVNHNLMTCRGIAAFLVVLEHSIIRYPIDLRAQAQWCVVLSNFINSFHMPLFFILSGYLTSVQKIDSPANWLQKHCKRLLLPCFAMGVVDMLPRLFLQSFVHNPSNIQNSILNILLYGGYFWFLIAMFLVQAVTGLWVTYGNRNALFAISAVLMIATRFFAFPQLFRIDQASYYLFFYLLGGYYREYEKRILKHNQLIGCASFLLVVTLGWIGNRFTNILVAVAACWLAIQLSTWITACGKNRLLELAGQYSLQIYLFNGMTLGVSRTVLVRLGLTNPLLLIVGNTILVLVMEAIAIFILKQLPAIAVLFGMRREKQGGKQYATN